MIFRVSHLASFHEWERDDELEPDWMIERVRGGVESDAMRKGTAFHRALEASEYGTHDTLEADGYVFRFDGDFELQLPRLREVRCSRAYGDLIVTGQVDAIDGRVIQDHKTTAQFDAERYLGGQAWKLYLDIFDADVFRWNVVVMQDNTVKALHRLEQVRYPGLHEDCARLAQRFREFAEEWL